MHRSYYATSKEIIQAQKSTKQEGTAKQNHHWGYGKTFKSLFEISNLQA
jgi:hypothetical protein